MDIKICGYLSASFLLEQQPLVWDAIVILDTKTTASEFVLTHAVRHLVLHFDDIEQASDTSRRVVTSHQLAQALEFAASSTRLVICCRAGQSRSAALAYLVACKKQGVTAATKLIDPRRHVPNRLVVSLGASLLNDPSILDAFEHWRDSHRDVVLADYYDEIESEIDALVARGAVNRISSPRDDPQALR